MVKDEARIIENCLNSIPPDLIDYFVIHDTGSTDDTIHIIRKEMHRRANFFGEIEQHKWENFGANKTKLLQTCKGKSDYILMMDADHLFKSDLDSQTIKSLLRSTFEFDQLMIKIVGGTEYRLPQLIRNNQDWSYVGVVHEYLSPTTARANFNGFSIIETDQGSSRADKFQRDALLLEEGLKQEPDNSRYLYYLAQSYLGMGNMELALKYFRKRSNIRTDWEEERWMGEYKAACVREIVTPPEGWRSVVNDFVECFRARPRRLEPLCRAVRLCRANEDYGRGWRNAQLAKNLTQPEEEVLFLEPQAYDWEFVFEAGICAYYSGDKKWFKEAMDKTIASKAPDHVKQAANNNLQFISI